MCKRGEHRSAEHHHDMRRYLVMEESKVLQSSQECLPESKQRCAVAVCSGGSGEVGKW